MHRFKTMRPPMQIRPETHEVSIRVQGEDGDDKRKTIDSHQRPGPWSSDPRVLERRRRRGRRQPPPGW